METLYLAVVKIIYPKGGIDGSHIPLYPSGGNIARLYPACYSTKVYIGGINSIIYIEGLRGGNKVM